MASYTISPSTHATISARGGPWAAHGGAAAGRCQPWRIDAAGLEQHAILPIADTPTTSFIALMRLVIALAYVAERPNSPPRLPPARPPTETRFRVSLVLVRAPRGRAGECMRISRKASI